MKNFMNKKFILLVLFVFYSFSIKCITESVNFLEDLFADMSQYSINPENESAFKYNSDH